MTVVIAPEASAAAAAGDLIKMNGLSSVYFLAADGKRYVFPNERTYFSWYSDFSSVKTIPQAELESYPLGANVTIRPGTKLVKITTNPKVYAVEPGGNLVWVSSETVAKTLFGDMWAKRITDIPDAFWNNYKETTKQVTAAAYPAGSLVKFGTSPDVFYINTDGTGSKIATESAFLANRFAWDNVITATITAPAAGTPITGAVASLIDTSSGAGGSAGAGTGLTVALSANTSPSSVLVNGQGIASLASFNLTAANDGAVKVTSFKVKRTGVSADATLSALYLYDGATRVTDSATVSSGIITWNNSAGIITVPKGETKTLTVKSDIAGSTAGQTVGVQIVAASDITTDGANVSGSFPISGNIHSIANATLATTVFTTASISPTTNPSVQPQDGFTLWQESITVGTRAVNMNAMTFRQIGSVLNEDLKNFKLFVDGQQKGSTVASLDANGYVTFTMAEPVSLTAAGHSIRVDVDIVGGSSRTTSLSLQRSSDVSLVDSEYNVPIIPTVTAGTFSAQTSGTQTISSGSLTITKKTTSPTGTVVKSASNVTLGSFEFKATGENVKVESLRANVIVSNSSINELRNGKIYADGVQIGSTADLSSHDTTPFYTEYSLGSSLIVKPGTPVTVEIKADIYDSDGTDDVTAGDTFTAQIASSSSNAQRVTSLNYFSTPSSDTPANQLTVATGGMTCTKASSYLNHTIVVPKTAYKIADFVCTANTSESVNLTTLSIDLDGSMGAVPVVTGMNDLYLIYDGVTTAAKSTVASTSNSFTINKTVAPNGTINVAVYSNILSTMVGTINTDLTASGITTQSSTVVNATEADGQTITISNGSITSAATETPLDQYAIGGAEVTAATYEVTAANDAYTIEEVAIKFLDTNVIPAVSSVLLYDGSTLLYAGGKSVDVNGYASTTLTTPLEIAANTTKTITVKLQLNPVGTGGATPGLNASTTLDTLYVRSSAGTPSYVSDDRQGNNVFVYKTYPVVTYGTLSTLTLNNGYANELYKFTVTPSSGGTVGLKQFSLGLSWVDEGNTVNATNMLQLDNWKLFRGSTDISSLATFYTEDNTDVSGNSNADSTNTTTVYISLAAGTEEQISSATDYTVKATPAYFEKGTTSGDQVAITFNGDTSAHSGANKYVVKGVLAGASNVYSLTSSDTGAGTAASNFIWSDRSAVGHTSASGTSTADWSNGYQIKNLPLTTTVLAK